MTDADAARPSPDPTGAQSPGSGAAPADDAPSSGGFQPVALGKTVPLDVCQKQAEGNVMQAVAQSAAIAVQDATDLMRSIEQVTAAAVATFTAQYVATQDSQYLDSAKKVVQELPPAAAETFQKVGDKAAAVMQKFGMDPSG